MTLSRNQVAWIALCTLTGYELLEYFVIATALSQQQINEEASQNTNPICGPGSPICSTTVSKSSVYWAGAVVPLLGMATGAAGGVASCKFFQAAKDKVNTWRGHSLLLQAGVGGDSHLSYGSIPPMPSMP